MKNIILKILLFFLFVLISIKDYSQVILKQSQHKDIISKTEIIFSDKKINDSKNPAILTFQNTTGNQGTTVTVPINTSIITNLAGFQFTIEYDAAKLNYVNCNNWATGIVGAAVLINSATPGKITFVYATGTGVDISSGVFFNINFQIKSTATGTTDLVWSDVPTVRKLTTPVPTDIPTTWNNGTITIVTPTLSISSVTGIEGSSVSVPVNALNISNLTGFQFTVDYDETKLTYNNCSDWNSGVNSGFLFINNDAVNGKLTFAYNNYPVTFNLVNDLFFNINFTINAGASGTASVDWSDNPTIRELSNAVPEAITTVWNNGTITISPASTPELIISDVTGVAGSAVVVPVNVTNFSGITGFQFTVDYDETKLTYVNCSNWDLSVNQSVLYINNDAVNGKLTFAYNNFPTGVNIADGLFFNLNFNINIGATGIAPVIWSDSPTIRELSNNVPQEIAALWTDGSVTITESSNPTLTIQQVLGNAGLPVTVPVYASDMVNIAGFQFSINYDETRLFYNNCSNWTTGVNNGELYINNDAVNGILTFAYNGFPSTFSIADGLFFNINFTVIAGVSGIAPVIWSDNPTIREISNAVPIALTTTWVDGRVIIDLNWDGSFDSDWQNTLNWTPEVIPNSGSNVLIPDGCPNYPVINDGITTAVCLNLTIETNASVTIAQNGQMTVNGALTNNRGVDGLIILSDNTGDGSLIQNTLGVGASVNRFLESTSDEWSFTSSPIINGTTASLNGWVYAYDETQDDWWTGPTYFYNGTSGWYWAAANMSPAIGYIRYGSQTTVNFQGNLNVNNTYSIPVSYTQHSGNAANGELYTNYDGWVLVGNPYSCALDWELINKSDDISNTVSIYNSLTNNYIYYQDGGISVNGGTRYIPLGQAFFVKTNDVVDGGNIIIPNTARVHNDQLYWKSNNLEILKIKVTDSIFSDETIIRINELATDSVDTKFDAFKQFAWNDFVPQVYTINEQKNSKFAINTFNLNNFRKVVPFGFKFSDFGSHTLYFVNENINQKFIILHDLKLENYKILSNNDSVEIENENGFTNDRFEIIFENNIAPEIIIQLDDYKFFTNNYFTFSLPKYFYKDINEFDNLTIEAFLADGNELPEWITFDYQNQTFSGICPEKQNLTIRVLITDMFGETAYSDFNLIFYDNIILNSKEISESINIYPIPANKILNIDIGKYKQDFEIDIYSVSGKKLKQVKIINQNSTAIEIEDLPDGVYFLKIYFYENQKIEIKKFIKK